MASRPLVCALTAAAISWSALATAQTARIRILSEGADELDIEASTRSLREAVGVQRAQELLLAEPSSDGRVRAIERLGALDGDEAVAALVEAMAPGTAVEGDPRASLAAVRGLARHAAAHEAASRGLAAALNRVRADRPETPLSRLVRATAAMGLAAAGTEDALTPLLTAVIGGGPTGDLARAALLAHRPSVLGTLGKDLDELSPRIIRLLGDLGDPRSIGALRKQLREGLLPAKRAAAVALAKLGDQTALELEALANKDAEPAEGEGKQRLEVAAAEVNLRLDTPVAARAVAALLGRAKTRGEGLRLAGLSLSPALVPTLIAVVRAKVTPAERLIAVGLLAKIGDDAAARGLADLLGDDQLADVAALGLARSPSAAATTAIEDALAKAQGAARRRLLRAAIVRHLQGRPKLTSLRPALAAALASKDAAERAVGAFGLVSLREREPSALLASEDPVIAAAATRGVLALGSSGLAALRPLLSRAVKAGDDAAIDRFAPALLVDPQSDGQRVPTAELARWAEGGGLRAALAAYRLARADSAPFRARLKALLVGTAASVRLHAALGLAASPEPDATSLLVQRYAFEPDAQIRGAVIRALSWRAERLAKRTLALARRLDPDDRVRALARMAEAGRRHPLVPVARGHEVAWVSLVGSAPGPGSAGAVGGRAVALLRGDGLALPVVSAPDGVLVVPGVAATERLRLDVVPREARPSR